MKVGERVRHGRYGDGVVVHVSMQGVLEVRFQDSTQHVLPSNLVSLDAAIEERKRLQRKREEREIAARHSDIQRRIRQLLDHGEFEEADALHERDAATFWPRSTYQAERDNVAAKLEAERQSTLRRKVCELLDAWQFDEADALYRAECSQWWPAPEYDAFRVQADYIKDFVRTYPSVPLSALDARHAGALDGRLSADDYAHLKLPKLRLHLARLGMPLDPGFN